MAAIQNYVDLFQQFKKQLERIEQTLSPDMMLIMLDRLNQTGLEGTFSDLKTLDMSNPVEDQVDRLSVEVGRINRQLETLIGQLEALLKKPTG